MAWITAAEAGIESLEPFTTYVIGAGASTVFGMPLGRDLLTFICACQHPTPPGGHERLRTTHRATHDSFRTALRQGGWSTVDAMLRDRTDMNGWAKVQIARQLLGKEQSVPSIIQWDWARWLYDTHLGGEQNGPSEGRFRIVTFNYERSLEIAWATMMMHRKRLGPEEAIRRVEELPITHVYGSLDAPLISYCPTKNGQAIGVGAIDNNLIYKASNGIKVMYEDREANDDELKKSRCWVATARRLVFLGFGFDQINLERIGIGSKFPLWKANKAQCYSTGFAMGKIPREEVYQFVRRNMTWGAEDQDCLSFLNEHTCELSKPPKIARRNTSSAPGSRSSPPRW